jgi:hypothetical protein
LCAPGNEAAYAVVMVVPASHAEAIATDNAANAEVRIVKVRLVM